MDIHVTVMLSWNRWASKRMMQHGKQTDIGNDYIFSFIWPEWMMIHGSGTVVQQSWNVVLVTWHVVNKNDGLCHVDKAKDDGCKRPFTTVDDMFIQVK